MTMTIAVRDDFEVFRERPGKVSWKVPAFCNNDWIALRLAQVCRDMGVGRPFDIAFGSPDCAWVGGRPSAMRGEMSRAQLERYFEAYSQFGITVALTLSRLDIQKSMLKDQYCNLLLDVAEQYGSEAIVYDDRLAKHIKKTHPGIRLIGSLDKALCDLSPAYERETAYYLRALDLYDEIVVRCEYVIRPKLLSELPPELYDRIEVIVNQICIPDCPSCRKHIAAIEEWGRSDRSTMCQPCYHANVSNDLARRLTQNVLISNKRINELVDIGIYKLKIGGRNAPLPKFIDYLQMYVFEPSGAIFPIRTALQNEYARLSRQNPMFTQYCLPAD